MKVAGQNLAPGWAAFAETMKGNHDRVNQMIQSFEKGIPSTYDSLIVMRMNSLQMLYARNPW